MIVQFRNEKVSNHGFIPITIDCNVVAFIVFEEGFHQPIKRTKQRPDMSIKQARKKLQKSQSTVHDGVPKRLPLRAYNMSNFFTI
ncbi:hypothetical protein TNCV_3902621 [Trichonephila clavipes]|nr:hypothetical protein TNCV_3902621 [Trichonephila clavipes]